MIRCASAKRVTAFTIRVIYKSGATIEFECLKFKFSRNSLRTEYSWELSPESMFWPLEIGADEVAAVWQVGTREITVEVDPSEDGCSNNCTDCSSCHSSQIIDDSKNLLHK